MELHAPSKGKSELILAQALRPVVYYRAPRTSTVEITFVNDRLVSMEDGSGEARKRLNLRVLFGFWFTPLFVLYCLLFHLPHNEY